MIQGYEAWDGRTEDEVKATYRFGLKNIVIAKWLKDIVDETCGNTDSTLIPNGIDMHEYSLEVSQAERKIKKVSMLYHQAEYKGSKFGIQALLKLKNKYPDLQAVLFGVPKRPKNLTLWIEYVLNANASQLRKIYNGSQKYLYLEIKRALA